MAGIATRVMALLCTEKQLQKTDYANITEKALILSGKF
jgi:hypothetical protein